MIGKISGYLKVIAYSCVKNQSNYWMCECICGKIIEQRAADINRQKAKSCGCKRYEFVSNKLQKVISGQKFGRLTIITKIDKQSQDGSYFYDCLCDCGNKKVINGASIRTGATKSCGCLKIEMNMKRYENGGHTGNYHSIRRKADSSKQSRAWKKSIYERDNYTCQSCNLKSIGGMCAHHIKEWSLYPDMRFDVSNGITLCRKCHTKIHSIEYSKQIKEVLKLL